HLHDRHTPATANLETLDHLLLTHGGTGSEHSGTDQLPFGKRLTFAGRIAELGQHIDVAPRSLTPAARAQHDAAQHEEAPRCAALRQGSTQSLPTPPLRPERAERLDAAEPDVVVVLPAVPRDPLRPPAARPPHHPPRSRQ